MAAPRLRTQIATITAARTLINTSYRMVYPFLPTFARALGVDVEAIALAVTARSSLGLFSPAFGTLADRLGRRAAMLLGVGAVGLSLLLMTALPVYAAFVVGVVLMTAGKITYDTAMQAFVGDQVAYERRGLAIGITELAWSLAFLVGIPLAGWLIARAGWNAPFPVLAILLAGCGWLLWRLLPHDGAPGTHTPLALPAAIRIITANRPALAGLGISLLTSMGNELVSIVFGLWLEGSFGLQIAALGAASIVIGMAEMAGEGAVIGLVDRLGKRRAVAAGLAGSVFTALVLPLLGGSITGALVGLFLFYLTFEFTLVTVIALMTELAPRTRATLMAGNVAFQSIGRAIGAPLGTALFAGGILLNGGGAMVANLLALTLLLAFIPDQ
ncbi:MAG: MFS transporter [Anaerolineae bacterium]